jgi:hypothetical protein
MNKELAKVVATALKSGLLVKSIPKNANGDTHAFCVTGILCHIAAAAGVVKRVKGGNGGNTLGYVSQSAPATGTGSNKRYSHTVYTTACPPAVLSFFGMKNSTIKGGVTLKNGRKVSYVTLETLNDTGVSPSSPKPWTFAQLAKLFESRPQDIGA